jgi:hypothetical protein
MNEETLARAIKKRQATCQKIGFFRDTFVARVLPTAEVRPERTNRFNETWPNGHAIATRNSIGF